MENGRDGNSVRAKILAVENNIAKVMVGCEEVTRLILTAFITGGHVLLEDLPGTGKTTLARTLARSVDAGYQRIQFTPDLLPTDVTGLSTTRRAGTLRSGRGRSSPIACLRTRATGRRRGRRRGFWSAWRKSR